MITTITLIMFIDLTNWYCYLLTIIVAIRILNSILNLFEALNSKNWTFYLFFLFFLNLKKLIFFQLFQNSKNLVSIQFFLNFGLIFQ